MFNYFKFEFYLWIDFSILTLTPSNLSANFIRDRIVIKLNSYVLLIFDLGKKGREKVGGTKKFALKGTDLNES